MKSELYNPETSFSVHPTDALYQINGLDWWLIGIHLTFRSLAPLTRKIGASEKQSIPQDHRALHRPKSSARGRDEVAFLLSIVYFLNSKIMFLHLRL